jgi:hypothetical protein
MNIGVLTKNPDQTLFLLGNHDFSDNYKVVDGEYLQAGIKIAMLMDGAKFCR